MNNEKGHVTTLLDRLDRLEAALNEIHEYHCGCKHPGRLAYCVCEPVEEFAVLDGGAA
jgi:hypothetical protein